MDERQPRHNQAPADETFLLAQKELLVTEHGIWVEVPMAEHAPAVADLYRQAYARSDFFAGRYKDPEAEIFNPSWLESDFNNPDHKWFVFTASSGQVIGSTGFFHDHDAFDVPVMVSDETQIAPGGRGEHIMDRFFRLVVPRIEASGSQLATNFVLTPESKGLRRTLQSEFSMVALGILPNVLKHKLSGITKSEIVSAKFSSLRPQTVSLLADFEWLYRIVQAQIAELPEPEVLPGERTGAPPPAKDYEESAEPASGSDPAVQQFFLLSGFRPVAYDPQTNSFTMAKIPQPMPQIDFIIENEAIPANKELVRYLKVALYVNQP